HSRHDAFRELDSEPRAQVTSVGQQQRGGLWARRWNHNRRYIESAINRRPIGAECAAADVRRGIDRSDGKGSIGGVLLRNDVERCRVVQRKASHEFGSVRRYRKGGGLAG